MKHFFKLVQKLTQPVKTILSEISSRTGLWLGGIQLGKMENQQRYINLEPSVLVSFKVALYFDFSVPLVWVWITDCDLKTNQ